jgi:hypothetical protein
MNKNKNYFLIQKRVKSCNTPPEATVDAGSAKAATSPPPNEEYFLLWLYHLYVEGNLILSLPNSQRGYTSQRTAKRALLLP